MKFICTQQNLDKGLSICEKSIGKNFTLPILQNILITCEKNKGYIRLSSTDLEVGIEVLVPAKIEEDGKTTVQARLFSSFIKSLPEEKIEITEKNNNFFIQCKNYKSNIKSESSKEFPALPKTTKQNTIIFRSDDFLKGINSVFNSISTTDTKPEISGVYIQFNEDDVCFAATDSFRLSERKIFLTKKNNNTNKIILPRKTCDIFMRIFSEGFLQQDSNEFISFQIEDNQITIQNNPEESLIPKIKIVSRIIDGEYPNYEQIIPTKFLTSVNVLKKDFIQHIKTASLLSSKINDIIVKISPTKQEINILAKDQEFGDHSSIIKCDIKGEEKEVILNYIYLLDGINNINSENITLKLNQENSPILLSSINDKNFKYILMPIKI